MKTPILKRQICLAICTLFIFSAAFSQGMMYKIPLNEQVQNSQQIIEGKVILKKSYWDSNRNNIYTLNIIEVYKVFKGDTVTTINVITSGGTVGLEMETVEPSLQLSIDDVGLFMLNKSKLGLQNDISEGPKFRTYASSQSFYKYDFANNTAANPFNKMGITNTLYQDIQKLTNSKYKMINDFNIEGRLNRNSGSISISSFSPATVTAGTATSITITGAGFGASDGTVEFRNPDTGGSTYTTAMPAQIISWNDSQIVVEVPTKSGTGNIRVTNTSSDTANSGQTLTVLYAQLNASYNSQPSQTQHIDRDGSGGYVWQMQTDFDANTAAKNSFIRALDTWRCGTEVNWTIGDATSTDVIASDDINIIRFDNGGELPGGILGRCTSRWSACIIGGNALWHVQELDIVFNDATNWNYSTNAPTNSQYDFETVAVHELGHGHQLGHIIANGAIMHYQISNGSFNRMLSANDTAGASDVHERSTTNEICGQDLMMDFDCSSLSVDIFNLADEFSIYPNPAKSQLYIKNTSNYYLEAFSIYDLHGRKYLHNKLNNTIDNTIQVNALSSGIYFIKIQTEGGEFTQKFIKK